MSPKKIEFCGTLDYKPSIQGETDNQGNTYYPYKPDKELIEVVNLAIALERPLLLEGDPGCGKTCLASAIAYEFTHRYLRGQEGSKSYLNVPKEGWWPFYSWIIKSSTRYRDGLCSFDAVLRLRDAQILGTNLEQLDRYLGPEAEKMKARLQTPGAYLKYGPLGEAMRPKAGHVTEGNNAVENGWQDAYRPIVLIDEIDKADSDFPNDLLREIENYDFEVPRLDDPHTTERVKAPQKPIIIMTSNRERPLPEPFLRRCIYYYVAFPEKRLKEIIDLRFGEQLSKRKRSDELISEAIERFEAIKEFVRGQPGRRSPGLSEFIDFLRVLLEYKTEAQALKSLKNLENDIATLGTLLKSQEMQALYQKSVQS